MDTAEAPPPAHKSKGEKLFDWGVYGALNYVGTFLSTVFIAERLESTKRGASLIEGGKKLLLRTGMPEKLAKQAVSTTLLMFGGSLMLPVIHAFEKRRIGIVAELNARYGDTTDQAAIAAEVPQQTWGSLVKARAVAWGVVFASFVGLEWKIGTENFKRMEAKGGEIAAALAGVPKEKRNAEHVMYRYGKYAALDVVATAASTVLLYTTSKFFARRREEHQEYVAHHPERARHGHLADAVGMAASGAPGVEVAGVKQHDGAIAAKDPQLEPAR